MGNNVKSVQAVQTEVLASSDWVQLESKKTKEVFSINANTFNRTFKSLTEAPYGTASEEKAKYIVKKKFNKR